MSDRLCKWCSDQGCEYCSERCPICREWCFISMKWCNHSHPDYVIEDGYAYDYKADPPWYHGLDYLWDVRD